MANVADLHKLQLCVIPSKGNEELIQELSGKPTVRCELCGAYAQEAVNVCSPRQLPELTWLGDGADNFKGS